MSDKGGYVLRVVESDQWDTVRWLWQAYCGDLATIVHGLPYADGRYQTRRIANLPNHDVVGYLAWRAHPNTGEDAPIAFALVDGVHGDSRSMAAFWVEPAARRGHVGRLNWLAQQVIERRAGPWTITFQHENVPARAFWRRVADRAFGPDGWTEEQRPVPGRPTVPPDHWIRGTTAVNGSLPGSLVDRVIGTARAADAGR